MGFETHALQGVARQRRADQEERDDEDALGARGHGGPGRTQRGHARDEGRDGDKAHEEPRELRGGFSALARAARARPSGDERDRHDPERPRELHGRSDLDGLRPVGRRGADDRARVVDRERRERPNLVFVQAGEMAERREDDERDGVEEKDRRERDRDRLGSRLDRRGDRRDRAASADRRSPPSRGARCPPRRRAGGRGEARRRTSTRFPRPCTRFPRAPTRPTTREIRRPPRPMTARPAACASSRVSESQGFPAPSATRIPTRARPPAARTAEPRRLRAAARGVGRGSRGEV